MEFDPKTQKLKCPYCDTVFDINDYVASHSSGSEATSADQYNTESKDENGQDLFIYSCGSCGGEILATETQGAMKCPFCSNNIVVQNKFDGVFKPDYIIPFAKTKEDAMEAYKKHVKSKRLVPKVFLRDNHIDEIRGVYVPFWIYSATQNYSGSFEATKIRTWQDSEYIHTETSYYDVQRVGTEDFTNVPEDGSKEMPDDLMESIEPFDTSAMVPFNMGYLAGFLANKYDVTAEENRARAEQRMAASASLDFRNTIQGYSSVIPRFENSKTSNERHKYAMYPVYVLNTTWKGKNYLFAMNGQTGKLVGNLPASLSQTFKYYFPFAGIVAVIAFILSIVFG